MSLGIGARGASAESGAAIGAGNTRGNGGRRAGGVNVGIGFTGCSTASEGATVGAGVVKTGGSVLRGPGMLGRGVGIIRGGIDGDACILGGVGEDSGAGVAVAAMELAEGSGDDVGAVIGDEAAVGLGCGLALGDGRTRGVWVAAGVEAGTVDAVAAGVGVAVCT